MTDTIFANIYGDATEPERFDPSAWQTIKSAFNLENDLVNVLSWATRPMYEFDPTFDYRKRMEAEKVPQSLLATLAPAANEMEFEDILARVRQEELDKAVLGASGVSGMVAAITAGMLSPTMYVPFAGQAKGGKAFAEVVVLAAAGATAQEAALFYTQETRTEAESLTGIAMATALGGLLGGAWLGLTRSGRARLAADVEVNQNFADVVTGPLDTGHAPSTKARVEAPTRSELEVTTRAPDLEGRDRFATERAGVEPPEAPTSIRMYVAETETGPVVFRDREAAATAAPEAPLRFVDVPNVDERLGLNAAKIPESIELTETELAGAKEIYRGADPESVDMLTRRAEIEEEEVAASVDMGRSSDETTIPTRVADDASPAGAQVARTRNTRGLKAAPSKWRQAAMNTLGHLSPHWRAATNRYFPSLRDAMLKLDTTGLTQAGLDEVNPSAVGGPVIERIKTHDTAILKFTLALDLAWFKHLYPGQKVDPSALDVAVAQAKSKVGALPPGKMSWGEFNEAVYDGLSTGEFANAEAKEAAGAFRDFFAYYNQKHKEYLAELQAQGLEVDPLYKELTEGEFGKGVSDYAHQIYDSVKIQENLAEFINDHLDFYRGQLEESFAKDLTRMQKRKGDLEFQQRYVGLSEAEKAEALADIESGIELLDELPEMQDMRQQRLDLQHQARDEGWSKEQLREQLKELEESGSPEWKQLAQERKTLMADTRRMRKLGGNATTQMEKFSEQLEKVNGLIEGMFRSTIAPIARLDLSIAKAQTMSDADLRKASTKVEKALKALQGRQVAYKKLLESSRPNMRSRDRVLEAVEKRRLAYDEALRGLEDAKGREVATVDWLRELNTARELAVKDATTLVRSRADKASALEEKLEAAGDRLWTPEDQHRALDQIGEELLVLEIDFETKWRGRGNQAQNIAAGETDFEAAARELAATLSQKLSGAEIKPAYFNLIQGERGPQLLRALTLPYDVKGKWLIKDTETVARAFDRQMGADLEIWRAMDGHVNGSNVLDQMGREATDLKIAVTSSKFVKLPKNWVDNSKAFHERVKQRIAGFGEGEDIYLDPGNFSNEAKEGMVPLTPELQTQIIRSIDDDLKHQQRNWNVAIQRLRRTRMVPQNAQSLLYRGGRTLKDANTLTMMGRTVISSIPDIHRSIMRHGVQKVWGTSWQPLMTNVASASGKKFRVANKKVNRQIGLTLETMLHSRQNALFDLVDDHVVGRTRIEKLTSFMANKMGIVALFGIWTDAMKSMSAAATHATLASYIPEVYGAMKAGTKFSEEQLKMMEYLRALGLDDGSIRRIGLQMEGPNGVEYFSNGAALPNLDDWTDGEAFTAYAAAVQSEVNKLIVTPGLERPNWTDENMAYSMVAQFKSFTFASNTRMMMSGLQGNEPYLLQGIASGLAFGTIAYYLYALSVGGKTLERANQMDAQDWIYEAIDRSGLLGALSLGQRVGEQIPALNQYAMFGGEDKPFRRPTGMLGQIFGPSVGQMEKMAEFLKLLDSDNPSEAKKARKILRQVFVPYQNHFLLGKLFDRAGETINSTLGN
jgi:hypothetical protein